LLFAFYSGKVELKVGKRLIGIRGFENVVMRYLGNSAISQFGDGLMQ
jgi:hypothetical protein